MGTWDISILVVPFLVILAMRMFALDELFAKPKRTSKAGRSFCEVDRNGKSFGSDPDGRPWHKGPIRQIEARFVPTSAADWVESLLEDTRP